MGRKLYVGNLPYEIGETELQELFATGRIGRIGDGDARPGDGPRPRLCVRRDEHRRRGADRDSRAERQPGRRPQPHGQRSPSESRRSSGGGGGSAAAAAGENRAGSTVGQQSASRRTKDGAWSHRGTGAAAGATRRGVHRPHRRSC